MLPGTRLRISPPVDTTLESGDELAMLQAYEDLLVEMDRVNSHQGWWFMVWKSERMEKCWNNWSISFLFLGTSRLVAVSFATPLSPTPWAINSVTFCSFVYYVYDWWRGIRLRYVSCAVIWWLVRETQIDRCYQIVVVMWLVRRLVLNITIYDKVILSSVEQSLWSTG